MAKLYDHKQGKYIIADEDRVDELMNSGNYTFQPGEMIPVRLPDGSLGTMPSENAQAAWADGIRWPTTSDKKADFDKKNDAIKRAHSTEGSTFGVSAIDAASMGLVDAGLVGAENLGVPGLRGYKEARNLGKETSPKADIAGKVVGTAAAMLGGGSVVGLAGKGSKALVGAADAAMTARGVGAVTKEVVKGVAEGAYWGLGSGISSAALGNPEDAVTNLVSDVGLGALTGGVFGGALGGGKVAAPYLRQTMDKGLDLAGRTVSGAARGIVKGISKPVMAIKGQSAEYKALREILGDDAFMKVVNEGGDDAVKVILNEAKRDGKDLIKESRKLDKAIKDGMEEATVDQRQVMTDALNASGNDVRAALEKTQAQMTEIGTAFDDYKASLNGPALYGETLIKSIEKQAVVLSKYGSQGKAMADDILSKVKTYGAQGTERAELQMLREVKSATAIRKGLQGDAHDVAKRLHLSTNAILVGNKNPKVARYLNMSDNIYGANKELGKIFNKALKKGGGIENFLYNAKIQLKTAPLLTRLKEFVPELQAVREAGNNLTKQRIAYNDLMTKYREVIKDDISLDNMEQFKEVIQDLVKDPKVLNSVKRIEEIQTAMQGIETLSPIDAAVKLKMALGQDVSGMAKYTKFGDKWQKLDSLTEMSPELGNRGLSISEAAVGYVAHAIAGPMGTGVVAANRIASNPAGMIKLIANINRGVASGKTMLSNAVSGAANKIVSAPVARIAAVGTREVLSREKQRERFARIKTAVSDMASPDAMAKVIEEIGGGTQNIPEIKLAIGMRLQTATQYLTANLPSDPLAPYAIGPQKSYWKPTDMEVAKYLRIAQAVDTPLKTIERVGDGTATLDEINAIKNVHPDIYKQLQESIINAIMINGDQIPYRRRVQLNILFQIPTDYSMTPAFISSMQATFAPMDQGGRPEGSRTKNIDISPLDSVQTETSKITYSEGL